MDMTVETKNISEEVKDSYRYESLDEMENVDVKKVEREKLIDIKDVHIDKSLDTKDRMMDYVRQVKNPYCYKHGEFIVKLSYVDTGINITDRLKELVNKMLDSDISYLK